MKIGIVGPIDTPIGKDSTSGTEVWTYSLAEKLSKLGHHVTLFANNSSNFSGEVVGVVNQEEIFDNSGTDRVSPVRFSVGCAKEMVEVVKRQQDFDVIHISVYSFQYLLPLVELINKPVVLTIHGTAFSDDEIGRIFKEYPQIFYVFISKQYEKKWPHPKKYRVIYNGIEVESFKYQENKSDRFFWMGRISQNKGVDDAIRFAEKSSSNLDIAGPIRDKKYFEEAVKPYLSDNIKYVGELGFDKKNKYYSNARAFLMPIKWEEPFGLVVVESLACGTPVIAYNRGAMPEIIKDGVTGILVTPGDVDGIIEASKKIDTIESKACRLDVEQRFALGLMVDEYISIYSNLIGG